MLPIPVKLDGVAVAFLVGVFHACLETARKAKVHRQVQKVVSVLPAYAGGAVPGTVIDHHIIQFREIPHQVVHHLFYILFLIVSRYHQQYLIHIDSSVRLYVTVLWLNCYDCIMPVTIPEAVYPSAP